MISRWLSWVGGADEEVLRHASGDRIKYSTLGGVILGTGFLAGASATFALQSTLGRPIVEAVLVGLVWGLLIVTLDRQLLATMTRQSGFWRNVGLAVPRLLLAVLLGFVISTPLVLQIFDPEIQEQLDANRNARVEQIVGAEGRPGEDGQPPAAEVDRIDELQAEMARLADPVQDPEVRRLTEAVALEQAETDRLSLQVGCEVGVAAVECSSDVVPGEGPRFRENRRLLGESQGRLADLQDQLTTATTAARDAVATAQADATSPLNSAETELAALVAAREGELASTEANNGLSARIEALDQLGRANPTVGWAHYILIAMFAAIEVLPVLSKILSLAGPPTLYEKLAARREQETVDHGDDPLRFEREAAEVRHQARLDLEKERARAQVEAGRRTNDLLVRTQQSIAEDAIERWSAIVRKQSDAELSAWYEQHRRGRPRTGRRAVRAAPATPEVPYRVRDPHGPSPDATRTPDTGRGVNGSGAASATGWGGEQWDDDAVDAETSRTFPPSEPDPGSAQPWSPGPHRV